MKTFKPKPPKHLSAAGKRLWRQIALEYQLDMAAQEVLTLACEAYGRAKQASAIVDAEGLVQADRFGQSREHPMLKAERDARAQCLAALKMLGLNLEPVGDIGRPCGS